MKQESKTLLWWALAGGATFSGLYILARIFDFVSPTEGVALLMGKRVLHRERAAGVDARLNTFLDWWEQHGPFTVMVGVDGGTRSAADQARLYAQGRTVPGPYAGKPGYPPLGETVTNAQTAVASAHGHASAVDLWPVINGKIYLNAKDPMQRAKYDLLGATIEAHGLKWGGRFIVKGKPFYDGPHAETPDWHNAPLVA